MVNAIGYDGVWSSPEGRSLVIDVKTTDAFRISLETTANYKRRLSESGEIASESSSVLIVVGRHETGDLEAQVRGSRYAWDVRLISANSLIKLVQLEENADDPEVIGRKIRDLLVPMEYTRLDRMIDVVFTTAKEVGDAAASDDPVEDDVEESEANESQARSGWEFTDSRRLQARREGIIRRFGRDQGVVFVRRSRALYWDATHEKRIACTVSKRYSFPRKGPSHRVSAYQYWYAFHPEWDAFLEQGVDSHVILACMDLSFGFAIPWSVLHTNLSYLNTSTSKRGGVYWHLHLGESGNGHYVVQLPKESTELPVDEYKTGIVDSSPGILGPSRLTTGLQ